MMGSVLIGFFLLLPLADPIDRADPRARGSFAEVEEVEANRPVTISPRSSLPSREESDVPPAQLQVVPTAGDRPTLSTPASLAGGVRSNATVAEPEGSRPIKLSPSTRSSGGLAGGSAKGLKDRSSAEMTTADKLSTGRSVAWWTTTGLGLAVVLTAIFLGGRVARRLVPGAMVGEMSGPVHLLHRTYLSPKHAVCLVKCGDRILVIGLSGDRMQTLSEIHDPQEIDFVRGQLMQVRPRSTTQAFREAFSSRTQLAEASTPISVEEEADREESRAGGDGSNRTFVDQLATLRDQISRWKARAGA
jgi:flagellar biogenesis protein FliO